MNVLMVMVNAMNSDYPAIGQYNIADYYKKHYGNDVQFEFKMYKKFDLMRLMSDLKRKPYDMICFGCYIWNTSKLVPVMKLLKRRFKDTQLLLGGPSISYDDETINQLVITGVVDYLVVGEGEIAVSDILQSQIHNKPQSLLASKSGIVFMDKTLIVNKREKDFVLDMNEVENPFIRYQELADYYKNNSVVYVESSRGCPYKCSYCAGSNPNFRSKTIETIMQELEDLEAAGYKNIYFLDGTLNYNIDRAKELFRRIIDKDWQLNIGFELKIEILDDELIDLMKKVGVNNLEIGLQSSNSQTLKRINRYHDDDLFRRNMKIIENTGIECIVDLIIALPGETLEDYLKSLDYCFDLGNVSISSNLLKLLPNTQLFNDQEQYGYIYDVQNLNKIVASNTMSKDEIIFAERTIMIVGKFWSRESDDFKAYIRACVKDKYNNSFSKLILALTHYVFRQNLAGKVIRMTAEEKKCLIEKMENCSSGHVAV